MRYKGKKYTLKKKYKIIFSIVLLFLLIILIFLLLNKGNKEEENINPQNDVSENINSKNKVEEEQENKVDENTNKKEKSIYYDSSWYTNGVLDPQKVVKKEAINKNNNLVLINKVYQVDASYVPDVYPVDGGYLQKDAKDAYLLMKEAAINDGVNLAIGSSYRSFDYQNTVFNSYLNNDSYAEVLTYSAFPGTSEHQTGLAIDFVEGGACDYTECFKDTSSGKWLSQNAYKYGFILRFPKDKQNITGYIYEPWHFRYVGDVAGEISSKKISLEEYLLL